MSKPPKIGIVGAGVVGRMIALQGTAAGWTVTLFDRNDNATTACSAVAPAMLAPYCELDMAEAVVSEPGVASLEMWQDILERFNLPVYFQRSGSLVVAHTQDHAELDLFKRTITGKSSADVCEDVQSDEITTLEPDLDRRFRSGLFFPTEGQIDSRGFLTAAAIVLEKMGATLKFNSEVQFVTAGEVHTKHEKLAFDIVIDARGYGAAKDLPNLRPVRGEVIRLHAPDVKLNRPVRLLHPRYPLYIVPRPNGHYIVGATMIESDDESTISVRSTLELLSATFTLNAAFGEARILETNTGLRPAYPNNVPSITHQPGLIRVNGVFRHGFLLAPKLAECVLDLVAKQPSNSAFLQKAA